MDSTSPFPLEGGCDCRAVRYRMETAPLFVHCCHCRWCQRETDASFALNAMIESERVQLLHGEVEVVDTPSNSGKGQRIARCPTCRWPSGATTRARERPFASSASARSTSPTACCPTSTSSPPRSSRGSCCPRAPRRCPSTTRLPSCGRKKAWNDARRCRPGRGRGGIAMGASDAPTGTRLGIRIFVADNGDCYDNADGLPQNQQ